MEEEIKVLDDFVSNYLHIGTENASSFNIEKRRIEDINFFTNFYISVKKLYELYPRLETSLNCEFIQEDYDFWLRVNINAKDSIVLVNRFDIESKQDIQNFFGDNELVSNLEDWHTNFRDNRTESIEKLDKLIETCISSGEIPNIKMTFSFEKRTLLSKLPISKIENINVLFFLSGDNFTKHLQKTSLFKFKDVFLGDKNATLLIVNGISLNCRGDYLGIFDLKECIYEPEKVEMFLTDLNNDIKEHHKQITEKISSAYLNFFVPPQFFNFVKELDCDEKIASLFYPNLLLNLFISFSDSIESDTKNYCNCTIKGKRIVYSKITVDTGNPSQIKLDGKIIDSKLYSQQINELFTFYLKMFGKMDTRELDETKILLAKKVISIYSRDYLNFLEHIEDITNSTYSDYKLYIQEKIDKFINIKEQLINYTFDYNKEVMRFNQTLSENLSNNLFKIIGFGLVFLVGLIAKANEDFGEIYLLIGPLLLILFIIFSFYQLRNTKVLYEKHKKQHKADLKYFENYLEKKDIKELSQTIGESVFDTQYKSAVRLLYISMLVCILLWLLLNINTLLGLVKK